MQGRYTTNRRFGAVHRAGRRLADLFPQPQFQGLVRHFRRFAHQAGCVVIQLNCQRAHGATLPHPDRLCQLLFQTAIARPRRDHPVRVVTRETDRNGSTASWLFLISVKVLVDTRGFVIRFVGVGKFGVTVGPSVTSPATPSTSLSRPGLILQRRHAPNHRPSKPLSNRWHRSRTIAVWPNPLPRAQSGCLTHSSPEGAAGDSPAPLPKGREPEVRVPFGPGVQRRKARQNAGSPLANPSILSLPCIGVQNLSPTPLLPCLQWVAPFLQSRFRRGSRIPGCPNPCTRQVATAPVSAPGILVRQTRGDGRRGLPSPFPDGSGHPWRRRCPERSSRS